MKILHFADLHIGMENYGKVDSKTGLNSRLGDFLNSLDFIVDYAIEKDLDLVLFAGDAYKTRDPSPTYQRAFAKRIKRLSEKNIPTVLLIGNHDLPNHFAKANTLDIYDTLAIENVYVSSKAEILKIETKSGSVQILTLPWLLRSNLMTKEEFKNKKSEEIHEIILKKVFNIVDDLLGDLDEDIPRIMIAHATVASATFGAEHNVMLSSDLVLPLSLFQNKGLDYVALGHLHKFQVLMEDPPVVYSGSIERVDFGEEKEDKGFVVVEVTEGNKTEFEFVKTPARKFKTIEIDLSEEEFDVNQKVFKEIEKHNLNEVIAKLVLNMPSSLDGSIKLNEIRKAMGSANYIAGIIKKITKEDREKHLDYEIDSSVMPLQALDKYFQARKINSDRANLLRRKAEVLLSEEEG